MNGIVENKEDELKDRVIELQNLVVFLWSAMRRAKEIPKLPGYVFEKP